MSNKAFSPTPLTLHPSTAKISEVFRSIQGEGPYAGVPQVFIRFFGCHMHCSWCDTPDSIGDGKRVYKEYTLPQLVRTVGPLAKDCHSVSLTGGEPLLQADFIKLLIPHLKKMGSKIYLETSGVLFKELKKVVGGVDIVAMDLKLPSSTRCRPFWEEHAEFLKIAKRKDCFIKTVISGETTREDVVRAARLVSAVAPRTFFVLQPNTFDLHNGAVGKCRDFQTVCLKYLSDVRILPQLHKFMKVR